MTGLLSLPTELICEIFDHLRPTHEIHPLQELDPRDEIWSFSDSYRTLAALTRTCRHIYPIAVQMLYKRYETLYQKPIPGFIHRLHADPSLCQKIKHVNILENGPCCKYKGRSMDEIKADLSLIHDLSRYNIDSWSEPDLGQLEIANIVSRAPNLEHLRIKTIHSGLYGVGRSTAPIWLASIIEAAKGVFIGTPQNNNFLRLRTVKLNLQATCSSDLVYLFCLPFLKHLSLTAMIYRARKGEGRFPWPIQAATSEIQTLRISNVEAPACIITQMIASCKSLSVFKCVCANDRYEGKPENNELWCATILAALETHCESLKVLRMDPNDREWMADNPDREWTRAEGFQRFHVLEHLTVPFMALLGRPRGSVVDKKWTPAPGWAGYPKMRDILPASLRTLSLDMGPSISPGAHLDNVLLSILPEPDENINLRWLYVDYDSMARDGPLPMNFWTITKGLLQKEVRFYYQINTDFDYSWEGVTCMMKEWKIIAAELAKYGRPGVAIAEHFVANHEYLMHEVESILHLESGWRSGDENWWTDLLADDEFIHEEDGDEDEDRIHHGDESTDEED